MERLESKSTTHELESAYATDPKTEHTLLLAWSGCERWAIGQIYVIIHHRITMSLRPEP